MFKPPISSGKGARSARSAGMAKVPARKANESFVPDFDDPRIRAEFWLIRSLREHGKGTHRQAGDVVPGFGLDYPLRCALGEVAGNSHGPVPCSLCLVVVFRSAFLTDLPF